MGFGLCNALATFSRFMNHVLEPYMNNFVIYYLDDICIYSETPEHHIEYLRLVWQKLREHQLFTKMPKCAWGRKETECLSVIVGNGTLRTHHNNVLSDISLCQKLKSILNLLSCYVLTMVSLSIISRIMMRM